MSGQDQAFSSGDVLGFLTYLCRQYRKRNLLVIWDGKAIHRSQAVKDWLKQWPGRLHLERLPAYSPELNLAELLWSQLKRSLANQVLILISS